VEQAIKNKSGAKNSKKWSTHSSVT